MEKTLKEKNRKKRMILVILALVAAFFFVMLLWIEIGCYASGKRGLIADTYLALTKNPSVEIHDIKLGRYITTVEEAVEIAEQYSLAWDERVVTGAVSIHYKSREDLINNKPDFWIYSGWTSNLSDGVTITSISGDKLVEFSTVESGILTPAVPLVKSESYPTNLDFIEFLDKLELGQNINWREFDDVYVRISLISNEHFSIDLRLDDSISYSFLYRDEEMIDLKKIPPGNKNS